MIYSVLDQANVFAIKFMHITFDFFERGYGLFTKFCHKIHIFQVAIVAGRTKIWIITASIKAVFKFNELCAVQNVAFQL